VTAETSLVDPASQHTVDEAERPGAGSTAPTAQHPGPAPGGGTHDRPELDTTSEPVDEAHGTTTDGEVTE
jgi:hypothetical protein